MEAETALVIGFLIALIVNPLGALILLLIFIIWCIID